ncbi:type II toxin-antitoxin system ParD family antitoxin [Maribacter polysaccharolyticus]|uniref:type II toxin-antitoxin system ParD family antitoxin n=1 Tax=Maribacter polysaccharolyticus TaxID=3020831 RepID=UPI00237F797C|nr:type II toxin-antitoxin system ParD family antitoxin [Maribacter polysaccharolyticus]MDE3742767.1 type II toxin-antitoxin system ParD family antitoxin [Maribacter polysaccharolyticus]
METVRKSITFTDQQDSWIKLRVQSGDFTNDSEYIRDLVRKDQEQNMKLLELKTAIDEGLQSGRSNLKISDIITKVDNGQL